MDVGDALQAGQAAWGNALSMAGITTTILSGYLVMAYMAGRDMTRSQIVIVNTLYVSIYSLTLIATVSFVNKATELMQIAVELSNQRISRPWPEAALALGVVWMFAMIASLKFMWDIRQKAKER